MEYKIGQKVRIKSKDWFAGHEFRINPDYCDKEASITGLKGGWYSLDIEPKEIYYDRICFEPMDDEIYKVTEKDLVGQIKDFPIEVVQKMIERQVEQGNEDDVTVFQTDRLEYRGHGGFDWGKTREGDSFWCNVIDLKNFDVFFEKYPKKEIDTHVYYRGNSERGDEIISELEKLGGTNNYGGYNGKCDDNLYFLDPISKQIRRINTDTYVGQGDLMLDLLKSFYTEKFLPEPKPETIEIDGKTYDKSEVLDKIKELKEIE